MRKSSFCTSVCLTTTLICFLAPFGHHPVYLAQNSAQQKDLGTAEESEGFYTPEIETRGIGGVRIGHTVASIESTYGESYSGLIKSFFDTAGSLGGSQEPPAAQTAEGYTQGQMPPGVAPTAQELRVEIDVIKEVYEQGRYQARQVVNGDVLTHNDNYKVLFQCNTTCYMYVAQLDATGKLDPIFPSRHFPGGNPVEAQTPYAVPPDNEWFYLDENTGTENIYFIASRSRISELDHLFRKFEEKNTTLVQKRPVSLDTAMVITRGIGGVRPGGKQVVNFHEGSQGQYFSTVFSSIQADFVVTRWFDHR